MDEIAINKGIFYLQSLTALGKIPLLIQVSIMVASFGHQSEGISSLNGSFRLSASEKIITQTPRVTVLYYFVRFLEAELFESSTITKFMQQPQRTYHSPSLDRFYDSYLCAELPFYLFRQKSLLQEILFALQFPCNPYPESYTACLAHLSL